jgi:hypothetical protein
MTTLLAADPALLFWSLTLLHIAGLVSILLTRLPRSHRVHALCHHGFFVCLLFIGVVTLFTILTRSNWWVWSGTTFSLMAVGSTADLGQAARMQGF